RHSFHSAVNSFSIAGDPMGRSSIIPSLGMAASALVLISGAATAQWSSYPLKNIPLRTDGQPDLGAPAPRTKDGALDLSGVWQVPYQGSGTDEVRPVPKYVRNLAADLSSDEAVLQPW